jgi:hypothetical protein
MIGPLVSGGQSCVDRAALDTALELGIPCGGWCPKERKAEDGAIPARYPLTETPSAGYSQRTRWNIRDADGTLILSWGKPTSGTLLTLEVCRSTGKPHVVIDLADETNLTAAVQAVRDWIKANVVQAASQHDIDPRTLSFKGAMQTLAAFQPVIALQGQGASPGA